MSRPGPLAGIATAQEPAKATILLVHGAFEDSSSWNGVVPGLERADYAVVSAADPLRSLKSDATYVLDLVDEFPGSTLGMSLASPVALSGGAHDLYVQPQKFSAPLAADLRTARVKLLAASQRPATDVALNEPSGHPAWRNVPAWFIYGSADLSIPTNAHQFMADRARVKKVVVIKGASLRWSPFTSHTWCWFRIPRWSSRSSRTLPLRQRQPSPASRSGRIRGDNDVAAIDP